jgi:hypothetical protein
MDRPAQEPSVHRWDLEEPSLAAPVTRHPDEAANEIKASLGISVPRVRYPDGQPDISGLAEGLGLR